MVVALTGPEGPLAHGVQPKIGGVSEGGEKALLDALNDDKVTKVKGNKTREKNKNQEAEEVGPKTKAQEATEKKEDVLKAAADARKYSIALKQCNYSGELVSGMMNFSTKMEKSMRRLPNGMVKTFLMKAVGTKSWIASMNKWHGIPLLRLGYP